jgi:hypothetical protein
VGYTWCVQEGICHHYRTETATWDLLSGQRLTNEDLFCKGLDIDELLFDHLQKASQQPLKPYGSIVPELKCDFAGLPVQGWHLTHEGIYFDEETPYFSRGYYFDLSHLPHGTLAAQESRDFSTAFTENAGISCNPELNIIHKYYHYAYNQDEYVSCAFLDESSYPTAAKINEQVMDYLNRYYTEEAIHSEFAAQTDVEPNLWFMDWSAYCIADRYILFNGSTPECYLGDDNWLRYSKPAYMLFDLQSGEQINATDLLKDGWQNAITEINPPYGVSVDNFDLNALESIELWPYSVNYLTIFATDSLGDWYFSLPMEYLKIS